MPEILTLLGLIKTNFFWIYSPYAFFLFMFIFAKNIHPIAPSSVTKDYVTQINSNIISSQYYQNNINPLVNDFINNHTLTSIPINSGFRTIIQNYVNYLVNNPVVLAYNSLSFFLCWKVYSHSRYKYYFRYTQSLYNAQSNSTIRKVKFMYKLILFFNSNLKRILRVYYNFK